MARGTEFDLRFAGRFFGKRRGIVLGNEDPRQLYRLQITVPSITGGKMVQLGGWAWPSGIVSGDGWGMAPPLPEKNAWVWVEFEEGDTSQPIWSYGPWGYRAQEQPEPNTEEGFYVEEGEATEPDPDTMVNMLPAHARGEVDDSDLGQHGVKNIPKSHFRGKYGEVWVWETPAGQLIEIDDTEGAERIQIQHITGALFEILPDGTIQLGATGNFVSQAEGNITLQSSGDLVLKAGRNLVTAAGGKSVRMANQAVEKKDLASALGTSDTPQIEDIGNVKYVGKRAEWEIKGDEVHAVGGSLRYAVDVNYDMQIGGGRSVTITRNDSLTVMESGEYVYSGATNVNPVAAVYMRHVYGGLDVELQTDPTGMAFGTHHVKGLVALKGGPAWQRLWAGQGSAQLLGMTPTPVPPATGSQLHLDGTGAMTMLTSMVNLLLTALATFTITSPKIFLGGPAAVEPLILGLAFEAIWAAHTHPTPSGMSGPPIPPTISPSFSKIVTSL